MKYIQIFELFKKKEKEEFKGKRDTYRFSNIHDDERVFAGAIVKDVVKKMLI